MSENKCTGCSSIEFGQCVVGSDCKCYSRENIDKEVAERKRKIKEKVHLTKIDLLTELYDEAINCGDCEQAEWFFDRIKLEEKRAEKERVAKND